MCRPTPLDSLSVLLWLLLLLSIFVINSYPESNQSRGTGRLRLERLQELPSGFRPYFTCVVAIVQLCMFIWLCWATTFTEVGLSPITITRTGEIQGGLQLVDVRERNSLKQRFLEVQLYQSRVKASDMYPTSSPGKSPGDEVDMYPTPERRNV